MEGQTAGSPVRLVDGLVELYFEISKYMVVKYVTPRSTLEFVYISY